jgi:hypothetical protein
MDHLRRTRLIIRYLLLLPLLIISACGLDLSIGKLPPQSPRSGIVDVDPKHQTCELPSDCVLTYVVCSGCECGISINEAYKDLYIKLSKDICIEYTGPVCEMYCPPARLECLNGLCIGEPSG